MNRGALLASIALMAFLGACGERASEKSPSGESLPERQAAPANGSTGAPIQSSARVRVVDLEGHPLAGMIPIVTRQANAFDEPVAMGTPTDASGNGSIAFPGDRDLCLRAWDQRLRYFPNNYYDVIAGGGAVAELMTVQMVEASAANVQVFLVGDLPAAETEVGMMLYHPTEGPWWPASGLTDGRGVVRFAPVPPGRFTFRLKTESGYWAELPEAYLPPAGEAHLGTVVARPIQAGQADERE